VLHHNHTRTFCLPGAPFSLWFLQPCSPLLMLLYESKALQPKWKALSIIGSYRQMDSQDVLAL
jgi:hypothetical protein